MTFVGSVGDDIEDVTKGEEDKEEEVISTPKTDTNKKELHVGMLFNSIEEVEICYQDYGGSKGFSIKKRSTYKTLARSNVTCVVFSCVCEGIYKEKKKSSDIDIGKQKRRTLTIKSGCNARMRIRWIKEIEMWKTIAYCSKIIDRKFQPGNIQLSKIPSLVGGSSNVGFGKRDVWNHARTIRRKFCYDKGDAEGMKDYFKKMATENPYFFYAIQCDSEGRASNFFWVDARSHMAYSQFGDAVTFDTTYRTNRYSMPFAPFTGVNHHRQSILFGCALLENEVEDTFVWLFETWLEAMGGKAPISIITDQDLAMRSAIAKVSERQEDFTLIYKKRFLNTNDLILEYASDTYTRNMFEIFSKEGNDVCRLGVDETGVDGDVHIYVVSYKVQKSEGWVVTFNLSTKEGSCVCQLFEFFGIPCRHLIKVFDWLNYGDIPSYFILKRWKKYANRAKAIAPDGLPMQDSHVGFQAARVNDLCLRSTQLAYMVGGSDSTYKIVSKYLDKAYEEANEVLLQDQGNDTLSIEGGSIAETCISRVEGLLLDPRISQTKGRKRTIKGSEKEPRIKGGLELRTEMKKERICKRCKGNGHDSRNCPKFPRMKSHNTKPRVDDRIIEWGQDGIVASKACNSGDGK